MLLLFIMNAFAATDDAPDMALLEFIGEGVTAGDGVVDPMGWQAMQEISVADKTARQQDQTAAPQQDKEKPDHE